MKKIDSMDEFTIKKATSEDMEIIYMMGFEVWNKGQSQKDYLETCRSSQKLNSGVWYGLWKNQQLSSSLIVYQFSDLEFGFGSIATEKSHRGKGLATYLIQKLIDQLDSDKKNPILFLYSDITPNFYTPFGFRALPASSQKYASSTCMVRGKNIEKYLNGLATPPDYF